MPKVPQIVRKTSKAIGISTMILGLAYGALWSASSLSAELSPKIESQNQLETLLEEEKKKLNVVPGMPIIETEQMTGDNIADLEEE